MRKITALYIISIIMLSNGALFTWMFIGTPLNIWRQVIWVIGLVILAQLYSKARLTKILKIFLALFSICLIQALYARAIYGFNITRLFYGFWLYFSGLPFIIFPYIYIWSGYKKESFYDLFTILGVFMSLGIIIDYTTGGIFTETLAPASISEGLLESKRYCFLSEAPTTFGVYYSLCLICTLNRMYLCKYNSTKLILLFAALLSIFGAWFTGSRQIVAVLALTFILSFSYYLFRTRDKKGFIIGAIAIIMSILPTVQIFLFTDDAYSERYSSESIKEDKRYAYWERGFKENVIDNALIFLFGKAFTLTQGQKAAPNEITGSHYENTFFSRISETGLVGLLLLLIPIIYFAYHNKKWTFFSVSVFSLYTAYLFICFVSPNGIHQTSQTALFITWGMFLNRSLFDKDYKDLSNSGIYHT